LLLTEPGNALKLCGWKVISDTLSILRKQDNLWDDGSYSLVALFSVQNLSQKKKNKCSKARVNECVALL